MNSFFEWLLNLIREFRFFLIVHPWELCVRTRFGKHITLLYSGVHLRIPFFDSMHITNTRLRVCHSPTQTLTTLDGKTISIAFAIGFSIVDPVRALRTFQDPESTFAALAGASSAEFVCERKSPQIKPSDLASYTKSKLEESTREIITIDFVQLSDFAFARTYRLLQEQWRPVTAINYDGFR